MEMFEKNIPSLERAFKSPGENLEAKKKVIEDLVFYARESSTLFNTYWTVPFLNNYNNINNQICHP